MKKLLAPMMATALIFAGGAAFAADTSAPPAPDGKHPPKHDRFKAADKNEDGFLTKDEMKAQQEKRLDDMFERTDTNKDGKLSQDEMKAGREAMKQRWKERKEGGPDEGPGGPPPEEKKD